MQGQARQTDSRERIGKNDARGRIEERHHLGDVARFAGGFGVAGGRPQRAERRAPRASRRARRAARRTRRARARAARQRRHHRAPHGRPQGRERRAPAPTPAWPRAAAAPTQSSTPPAPASARSPTPPRDRTPRSRSLAPRASPASPARLYSPALCPPSQDKDAELSAQVALIMDGRAEKERLQQKIQGMQNTIDNIQKELTGRLAGVSAAAAEAPEQDAPRRPDDASLYNFLSDGSVDGDALDPREVGRRFQALQRGAASRCSELQPSLRTWLQRKGRHLAAGPLGSAQRYRVNGHTILTLYGSLKGTVTAKYTVASSRSPCLCYKRS
ncbi:unnamed protein product [Chrysodeixis includens]|uniref:Uncharacterized protein n=1 Tax=Chrysodeixis includens TaxID=689277 RepID=A0A9N8PYQ0_CHRIL|nr:unnamed protein product [Chrysodeixis includens]